MEEWIAENGFPILFALLTGAAAWGKSRGDVNGLGERLNELRDSSRSDTKDLENRVSRNEGKIDAVSAINATLTQIDGRLKRIEGFIDKRLNS